MCSCAQYNNASSFIPLYHPFPTIKELQKVRDLNTEFYEQFSSTCNFPFSPIEKNPVSAGALLALLLLRLYGSTSHIAL